MLSFDEGRGFLLEQNAIRDQQWRCIKKANFHSLILLT